MFMHLFGVVTNDNPTYTVDQFARAIGMFIFKCQGLITGIVMSGMGSSALYHTPTIKTWIMSVLHKRIQLLDECTEFISR